MSDFVAPSYILTLLKLEVRPVPFSGYTFFEDLVNGYSLVASFSCELSALCDTTTLKRWAWLYPTRNNVLHHRYQCILQLILQQLFASTVISLTLGLLFPIFRHEYATDTGCS
ncbi:hypothetical protein M378DRAFT_160370 [Amanita muscaria Koide BX008]|uniref:Uncharacterized protein n=1 Tax=Amanita muscaria (strain Koide BX008) TaxID=946122 RepID=A0A0C2WYE6_AMAMK|nr:hypothetical protein M378DRAFT_160370 [Amanita muscaria Koide BX008]